MKEGTRKPRADSLRNREQLLAAAKAAFAEVGADVPLDEIARRAGVGIGTLYRHFPTREAILAAVYEREAEQLSASAGALLAARPPREALEAWMHLLVDYLATKRVVAPALAATGGQVRGASGGSVMGALARLVEAGRAGGDIRTDIDAEDLYRMLMGFSHGYEQPGWEDSARRLIGVLVAGLEPDRET